MKNLLLVLAISLFSISGLKAQSVDFETEITVTPVFGATSAVIDNPNKMGLNISDKCLQIGRTSALWYELVDVPISFTIPANETRYVHIMVLYAEQPDFGIRYNTDGTTHRRINDYTTPGQWQDLVMELTASTEDLVVSQIRIGADVGNTTFSSGYILNNTDAFGLVDQIVVNADPDPRAITTGIQLENEKKDYRLFCVNRTISIRADEAKQITIFNTAGAMIKNSTEKSLDVNISSTGIYIVKIGDKTEKVFVK